MTCRRREAEKRFLSEELAVTGDCKDRLHLERRSAPGSEDLHREEREDAGKGVVDAAQHLAIVLQPAGQPVGGKNDGDATGSDRTMKQKPRKSSLPVTSGSAALTNCGRKVMKKMMTFGLSRLTQKPLRNWRQSGLGASPLLRLDRRSSPCGSRGRRARTDRPRRRSSASGRPSARRRSAPRCRRRPAAYGWQPGIGAEQHHQSGARPSLSARPIDSVMSGPGVAASSSVPRQRPEASSAAG